jgi:hypothetical protein
LSVLALIHKMQKNVAVFTAYRAYSLRPLLILPITGFYQLMSGP